MKNKVIKNQIIAKSQEELDNISQDDLKLYIDDLQKQKELNAELAKSFVLAKYILVARLQKKPLYDILDANPNLNLVGTIKNGQTVYFGFSDDSKHNIQKAQQDLVNNMNTNHNQYIYTTLKSKYPTINIQYINGTILPPQKIQANISPSSNLATKYEKPKNVAKIGKVMELLDTLSQTDNLQINHIYITKKHDQNIMRQTDYIAIYITINGVDKTLLINDDYGEASFVINEKIDKNYLTTLDKSYYVGYEINYDRNESNWLSKLQTKIIDKRDILTSQTSAKSSNSPQITQKLSKSEYISYYKDIFDTEQYGGITKLGLFTKEQILEIEIGKNKITAIATNIGRDYSHKDNSPQNPKGFRKMLCHLYGKSEEELQKLYISYYQDIFNTEQYGGITKLGLFTREQILEIEIDKNKIIAIAKNIGRDYNDKDNSPTIPKGFHKMLCYLYSKSEEELQKEYISYYKDTFNSKKYGGIVKLGLLTTEQISEIEIDKNKITAIATNIGRDYSHKDNKPYIPKGFRKMLCHIYGMSEEELQKEYISYYKNTFDSEQYGGIVKLGLFTREQIREIEIDKNKIQSIATNIGRDYSYQGNNVQNPKGFHKMLCYLYGKSEEELQKEYISYYKDIFNSEWYGGILKLGLFTKEQISEIEIDKNKITAIAKNIGRDYNDKDNKPYIPKGFRKMLCYLYGISEEELQNLIRNGSK